MCMITALSNSAYALIAPFLPIELVSQGVPLYMFGYIFSFYSVAVILCSPLVGLLLTKFKKRNMVQFGVFSMSFSMLLIAFSASVKSVNGFLAMCFIARFIQGFASCSIQTTCFSISGNLYREHQASVIGLLEMSCGIGLTTSPVIGSILYNWGGYMGPFLFYALVFAFFGLFLKHILPQKIDQKGQEDISKSDEQI